MTKRRINQPARRSRERRVSVRAIRRAEPDYRKLGRALLAVAQAEADAAASARPSEAGAQTPGREAEDAQETTHGN